MLIGVLPGLGGANGVAILLPLTFTMPPTSAIIMLSCIYWGALFGGAITSILFNIPGEPWSVATTFDGYPMAQQGRAGEALTAAFTSSFVGALFAVHHDHVPGAAGRAASRSSSGRPSSSSVQLLTFCSFVGMGREPPVKTIASMMLGFALAAVGLDTVTGQLRMTFGYTRAAAGLRLPDRGDRPLRPGRDPAHDGGGPRVQGQERQDRRRRSCWQTWKKLPRYWVTSLRACLIGCWMGITPGGATPASFMSYGMARRFSKNGDKFGEGEIEGVIAPETAAHAAGTSALLPMLTLGIPGLADRGGAARRPADLGPAAGAAAVRREEGLRLGPDRQHVPRQHRRPDHRADHGAVVGGDPAHSVLDHRAGDRRDLRDRRVHGPQQHVRRLA